MFPSIKVEPEYYCAAFYGGTVDELPIIGMNNEFPYSYFLFAFGANGTVYSQLLAKIIADVIIKGNSIDLDFICRIEHYLKANKYSHTLKKIKVPIPLKL